MTGGETERRQYEREKAERTKQREPILLKIA